MLSVTWGETLPKLELPPLNPAQASVGASARHLAPGRAGLIKETWAGESSHSAVLQLPGAIASPQTRKRAYVPESLAVFLLII